MFDIVHVCDWSDLKRFKIHGFKYLSEVHIICCILSHWRHNLTFVPHFYKASGPMQSGILPKYERKTDVLMIQFFEWFFNSICDFLFPRNLTEITLWFKFFYHLLIPMNSLKRKLVYNVERGSNKTIYSLTKLVKICPISFQFTMGWFQTESCCGCLSLRTGGMIIGIWRLFYQCFVFLLLFFMLNRFEDIGLLCLIFIIFNISWFRGIQKVR